MQYAKKDAVMTRGLAILAMVVLHLFFREGPTVLGTPLLWFSETVPVVSWAGFFAEFCAPLYSLCAGYGYYLLYKRGKNTYRDRAVRILNLMVTYWIILCLFSLLGLFFDKSGTVPGSWRDFLLNIILVRNYCGAWWYLRAYVTLLLLPAPLVMFFVNKLDLRMGACFCFIIQVLLYFLKRFGLYAAAAAKLGIPAIIYDRAFDFFGICPYVWIGMMFCRDDVVRRLDLWLSARCTMKQRKLWILLSWVFLFIGFNLIHKAVLVGLETVWMFLTFNLYEKSGKAEKVFLFLGKHSTNIWLIHMFFYSCVFRGLVEVVRYPLFMLLFMLLLCICSSYIVFFIRGAICGNAGKIRRLIRTG